MEEASTSPTSAADVSQYDVGAGGALSPKSPPTVIIGTVPAGVAVSPDGTSVYVGLPFINFIGQFDVGAGGALSPKSPPIVLASPGAGAVAVSPDGGSVYAPGVITGFCQGGDFVSQYDVGAGGALAPKSPATVPAGDKPVGVAVSPEGGSVYTANQCSDDVSQYDVGAGGALAPKSPATVPAGDVASGVAVSPAKRLPTSKEDCKNGGWRDFGFKSQGQCIRFVQNGASG